MCKSVKIFIGLNKTCLGVLDRRERGNDNETGLKEERVIEMSTTVLPLRDARSFALNTYRFSKMDYVYICFINLKMYKKATQEQCS